jgi:hypothetical protein
MRIVRTRTGARVEEGGLILSEILDRPGATDTLFDVLAAAVAATARGGNMGMLGFAGGGVVAPLRAMGYGHPVEACDLDLSGERIFRELSAGWCGEVTVAKADAVAWLRARRQPFDVILEDLSASVDGEITKPAVSLEVLPQLMARRLTPRGVAVMNVLPVPGHPWTTLLPRLAAPWRRALCIVLDDWENRILLAGADLDPAEETSRAIRRALRAIGSREADGISVRTLRGR